LSPIAGNEARQDREHGFTAPALRPTNRQHLNLATPAAQPPIALAMNRVAANVCALWLMLLAADLRPQRRLDVGDVRLMMIACINQN
jgi:hypothetical protein